MDETGTSKLRWFIRGAAGGFILFAALNALSWFFLSEGWSDLCGATYNAHSEAIGVPFVIWREEAGSFRYWEMSLPNLGLNLLYMAVTSTICGFVAATLSPRIESMLPTKRSSEAKETGFRITFSVRGLLICTTLIAVAMGLTKSLSPRWLLGVIYFGGPLILILIAMGPAKIPWEQRSIILTLTAIVMLTGAVFVGLKLRLEFDRVLLGVFICWVPQSVFAAALITGFVLWRNSPTNSTLADAKSQDN